MNRSLLPCSCLALTLAACSGTTEVAEGKDPDAGTDATHPPQCWSIRLQGSTQVTNQPAPRPEAVAVAADGSVVVAGSFWHVLRVGDGEPIHSPYKNVFVLKLRVDGTTDWVRTFAKQDPGDPSTIDLAIRQDMHPAIAGLFCGSLQVDATVLEQIGTGSSCDSSASVFALSFDLTGSLSWAHAFGEGMQSLPGIATDSSGMTAVAGTGGTVDLDGIGSAELGFLAGFAGDDGTPSLLYATPPLGPTRVAATPDGWLLLGYVAGGPSDSAASVGVLRLDSTGGTEWLRSFGNGEDMIAGVGLAVAASRGPVFVGAFRGMLDFGSGIVADNHTYNNEWGYVAQLDDDGSVSWAKFITIQSTMAHDDGVQAVRARTVTVDPAGTVLVGGDIAGRMTFDGPGGTQVEQKSESHATDAFIAAYGSDGTLRFGNTYGAQSTTQTLSSLAVGPGGEVVAAGNYAGGALDLGCGPLPHDGGAFVVRYEPGSLAAQ